MITMADDVTPEVVVVVHPIDSESHPTYPTGYRWAVQVGGGPFSNLAHCVNAGHEATESMAGVAGESHGVAVTRSLRIMGVPARYSVTRLDWDPIPAEADDQPLVAS
jgi:hypothetical protein